MLVDIREFIQNPEWMISEFSSELIRLNTLYKCLRCRIDAANCTARGTGEFTGTNPSNTLRIFIPDDRELRVSCLLLRERLRMDYGQFVDNVIQTTADIVNDIANQERKRFGGEIVSTGLDDIFRRNLRVWHNTIREMLVSIEPSHDLSIELFKVLKPPVYLEGMAGDVC